MSNQTHNSRMTLKARREQESKIHITLHQNIYALTLLYPPTEDFKRVFANDMFVKSNKTAFQQIIYYLLRILDSDAVKIKIPTWPICTPKQEIQFRGEVIKYINELNDLYKFADIPSIMLSHLISPGGYKFVTFMLKLSQLVMSVVIQRDSKFRETFLFPIKPNKNLEITKRCVERLRKKTEQINADTLRLCTERDNYIKFARKEAKKIVEEHGIVKEKLKKLQSENNPPVTDLVKVNEPLSLYSSFILSKCLKIEELKSYLFANKIVLKFNGNEMLLADTILGSVCNCSQINLVAFFSILATCLSKIQLQKPHFSTYYLDNALVESSETNRQLLLMCKMFGKLMEESVKLSGVIGSASYHFNRPVCEEVDDVNNTEVLAIPLTDSSS